MLHLIHQGRQLVVDGGGVLNFAFKLGELLVPAIEVLLLSAFLLRVRPLLFIKSGDIHLNIDVASELALVGQLPINGDEVPVEAGRAGDRRQIRRAKSIKF